jgi:hypothetical protein
MAIHCSEEDASTIVGQLLSAALAEVTRPFVTTGRIKDDLHQANAYIRRALEQLSLERQQSITSYLWGEGEGSAPYPTSKALFLRLLQRYCDEYFYSLLGLRDGLSEFWKQASIISGEDQDTILRSWSQRV